MKIFCKFSVGGVIYNVPLSRRTRANRSQQRRVAHNRTLGASVNIVPRRIRNEEREGEGGRNRRHKQVIIWAQNSSVSAARERTFLLLGLTFIQQHSFLFSLPLSLLSAIFQWRKH